MPETLGLHPKGNSESRLKTLLNPLRNSPKQAGVGLHPPKSSPGISARSDRKYAIFPVFDAREGMRETVRCLSIAKKIIM